MNALDQFKSDKNKPLYMPTRKDGQCDLKDWHSFVKQFNCEKLNDLIKISEKVSLNSAEGMLLDKAVEAKKVELAKKLFDVLFVEELTINCANSIIEILKNILNNSNINR